MQSGVTHVIHLPQQLGEVRHVEHELLIVIGTGGIVNALYPRLGEVAAHIVPSEDALDRPRGAVVAEMPVEGVPAPRGTHEGLKAVKAFSPFVIVQMCFVAFMHTKCGLNHYGSCKDETVMRLGD